MGWLGRRLKENGIAISNHFGKSEAYFDLTPAGKTLIHTIDALLPKYAHGRILDAGAGRLTYASRLEALADAVISVDRDRIVAGLSVIADIARLPFAEERFDVIFCSQTLEHVPDPGRVLSQFQENLKEAGILILTAPHLAYLHNEPHDYYRYTEYGLEALLKRAGFELIETRWSGGLLSFLGHLPSTLAVNLTWGIPGLSPLVVWLNALWTRGIAWLERDDRRQRRFALNMAVVARKSNG